MNSNDTIWIAYDSDNLAHVWGFGPSAAAARRNAVEWADGPISVARATARLRAVLVARDGDGDLRIGLTDDGQADLAE